MASLRIARIAVRGLHELSRLQFVLASANGARIGHSKIIHRETGIYCNESFLAARTRKESSLLLLNTTVQNLSHVSPEWQCRICALQSTQVRAIWIARRDRK
jgi:hypothetical protein